MFFNRSCNAVSRWQVLCLSIKPEEQAGPGQGHQNIELLARGESVKTGSILAKEIDKNPQKSIPQNKMCRDYPTGRLQAANEEQERD
jgi:hypothetical protein